MYVYMNVCMYVCRSNGRFSMSELSAVIEDEIKDVFKQYKPGDISGPTNLAGAVHSYMHIYIQFFIYTYIKLIRYSSLSNVESVSSCICRRYSIFFLYEMIDIFWSDYVYVCMYVCMYVCVLLFLSFCARPGDVFCRIWFDNGGPGSNLFLLRN